MLSFYSIFALEPIEKLLIEKAILPEQKQAVKQYLLKVAQDHEEMAQKYTELSKVKKKGKYKYQEKYRKEMEDLAQKFKDDAEVYKDAANKIK